MPSAAWRRSASAAAWASRSASSGLLEATARGGRYPLRGWLRQHLAEALAKRDVMANDKNEEDREQQGTARQHQERTTGSEQPHGGQSSGIWPGPDVVLGAWTSWMGSGSARAQPG